MENTLYPEDPIALSPSEPGQWLKLNEAAHALKVSEITLRRKIKSGKLEYDMREGRYYVYIAGEHAAAQTKPAQRTNTLALQPRVPKSLPSVPEGDPARVGTKDLEAKKSYDRERHYEGQIQLLQKQNVEKDHKISQLKAQIDDQLTLINTLEHLLESQGSQ